MNSKKSRYKHSNPTKTSQPIPVKVNGENKTDDSNGDKEVSNQMRPIGGWFKKLGEPLTVVTLLLFLATGALYFATRDLVHDAEKTAERQLRAYLVLDEANITRFVAGQTIEFHGIIRNTGQTPAYDIDGYTGIMYDAFPLPYPFPVISTAGFQESRAVLGRDQVVHARIPTKPAPTQETIDAINAGKMAVYVFGRVTYRDAFGIGRYTNYRLFYSRPNEGAGLLSPLGKEGNEAS